MARRDESILNLLVEYPWWVSVLVSGITFLFLKIVIPYIDFGSMAANAFIKGLSHAAPFVALILLLPAPISALNSWLKRKHPEKRRIRGQPDKRKSVSRH